MIRVAALYAVSGFVSLGYQVAWFRIFTDWFGSTNLTFALVVCNFIGGLGVGGLVSQQDLDLRAEGKRARNGSNHHLMAGRWGRDWYAAPGG